MSVRKPNIKDVQKRVANISIGASTLRNQGAEGMQEKATRFLSRLKLDKLREMPKDQFPKWLDEKTKYLMKRFKTECGVENNWGAARKAINIFLENAFYDRFLSEAYGLQKLEDMLELPLDKGVTKGLREDSKGKRIPKWQGIKKLDRENSEKFQKRAEEVAKSKPNYRYRIYLDLKYWRAKKAISKHTKIYGKP